MADVEYSVDGLMIAGVPQSEIVQSLKGLGHSEYATAAVLGALYAGISYALPSAFRYTTPIEQTDASCAVTYARSFHHDDWADGRSRVQAGVTPDERGFNARFHQLEGELDAVALQFRGLGDCVANLRGDLYGMARETEQVLTELRRQLAELRREQEPKLPKLQEYSKFKKILGYQFDPEGRAQILLQKGEEVAFLDASHLGLELDRPRILTAPPEVLPEYVGALTATIGKDRALKRRIAFGATVGELVEEMGTRPIQVADSYMSLASLLSAVPPDLAITTVAQLQDAMALGIVSSNDADATTVRAAVLDAAVGATSAAVSDAAPSALLAVDTATRDAISGAGVTSLGALATTDAESLVAASRAAGGALELHAATRAIGAARVALAVTRIGG